MCFLRVSFILTGLDGEGTPVAEVEVPKDIDPRKFCPGLPPSDDDLPRWHPAAAELVAHVLGMTGFVPPYPVARWDISCQRLYRK